MGHTVKVLHVISGLNGGGAEAVLYRLCLHGDPDRHQVISMGDGGKFGPMLEELGIRVDTLKMPRGRLTAQGLWRLFWLVRRSRADVVQTWMYHADLVGGILARLAGKRQVFWGIRHTTLDPRLSSRSALLAAGMSARVSRFVPRKIVCCAKKAAEIHANLGYDKTRMVVISNGYDLNSFKPDLPARQKVRNKLRLNADTPLLGFVARFDPQKDHANLISALGILVRSGLNIHCLLVGSGIDHSNSVLTAQIDAEGITSHVTLFGQSEDIPAIMNALDLHVMSSAFGEAFPNVLAEAMACGTPCVSTDVGDAAAIVGTSGRIVPPCNPEKLATAISDMLLERNSPGWSERCEAARDHITEHFSIETMVDGYWNMWLEQSRGLESEGYPK